VPFTLLPMPHTLAAFCWTVNDTVDLHCTLIARTAPNDELPVGYQTTACFSVATLT
jgi:hypothetical protein